MQFFAYERWKLQSTVDNFLLNGEFSLTDIENIQSKFDALSQQPQAYGIDAEEFSNKVEQMLALIQPQIDQQPIVPLTVQKLLQPIIPLAVHEVQSQIDPLALQIDQQPIVPLAVQINQQPIIPLAVQPVSYG